MKHGYIYKITIGPNYYFGQTVNVRRRRREHLSRLKAESHMNPAMQNAYNKYREYEFEVLEKLPRDQLSAAEHALVAPRIKDRKCMNNVIPLENGNYIPSEETRRRLSRALKGRVMSEETREKLRRANLGKKHSKETKRKRAEKRKKPCVLVSPSGERLEFDSANSAAEFLEVHCKTVGHYLSGERQWPQREEAKLFGWSGYYKDQEHLQQAQRRLYKKCCKPCVLVSPNGEKQRFESVTEAAAHLGMHKTKFMRRMRDGKWSKTPGSKFYGWSAYYE